MAHRELSTWQKATALVPLALLSGAWTVGLAATGSASAAPEHEHRLPDGTSVPSEPLREPASVSVPGEIAPGVPAGATDTVISGSSADGIPAAALAAYQRAAHVIDDADPACHLSWQLLAAIGRVESDHGRYAGSVLGDDGVSRPAIYGVPLDGSGGTVRVADTDGGRYDADGVLDRAVGPMQFIPSTWSVVGVDGDGDGVRDPQDIDDAALAAAVYLCAGDEDLSTPAGRRAAVYRYNHSQDYVDLVLAIMRAYQRGEFTTLPDFTAAPVTFVPDPDALLGERPPRKHHAHQGTKRHTPGGGHAGGSGTDTGTAKPPAAESSPPPKPTEAPTAKASAATGPVLSALDKAKQTCQQQFTASELDLLGGLTACGKAVVADGLGAVEDSLTGLLGALSGGNGDGNEDGGDGTGGAAGALTEAQAKAQCLAQGISALDLAALQQCVADLLAGG